MKYLINVTEVYRVDSETEVEQLIADAKADDSFNLVKYNREYKQKKAKGEVVDDWYKVTLIKNFGDEKDPDACSDITIKYE
jgi:hypothetical protein